MDGASNHLDTLFTSLVVQILDPPFWHRVLLKLFGESVIIVSPMSCATYALLGLPCSLTSFYDVRLNTAARMPFRIKSDTQSVLVLATRQLSLSEEVERGDLTGRDLYPWLFHVYSKVCRYLIANFSNHSAVELLRGNMGGNQSDFRVHEQKMQPLPGGARPTKRRRCELSTVSHNSRNYPTNL